MAPEEFVSVAEQTGLIGELTQYSLRAALSAAQSWREAGEEVGVAVNLPPRLLRDTQIVSQVTEALRESGLPARLLTLEVTEGAIMADAEGAIQVLRALRDAGIRLSIDDLGTGHSSLAYLKRLPVDEVKIDKAFVMGMIEDSADDAIVESVSGLARRLGMKCAAEGVESEAIFDRLGELGCEYAQGYWVARPLPASEVVAFVASWRERVAMHEATRDALRARELLQVPAQEQAES